MYNVIEDTYKLTLENIKIKLNGLSFMRNFGDLVMRASTEKVNLGSFKYINWGVYLII